MELVKGSTEKTCSHTPSRTLKPMLAQSITFVGGGGNMLRGGLVGGEIAGSEDFIPPGRKSAVSYDNATFGRFGCSIGYQARIRLMGMCILRAAL